MKPFKVRYRGTSNEWIIDANTIKEAKLEFHKIQQSLGQAPMVYSEVYIQVSKA